MNLPLLTPSTTRQLLDRLGVHPRKALGQNFLIEPNLVLKSVDMAELATADRVVEIGPGLGTLTRGLLNAGAEVFALEYDGQMMRHLEADLVPRSNYRLHLLEGDALEHPKCGLQDDQPFKIVANLPYAITTPWLEKVLWEPLPERMVLLMQKEAAQRILAEPATKSFGPISIFLQAAYSLADRHRVSPNCFYPLPDVDSALVRLDRKPEPFLFSARQREVVRQIFTKRRKQLKPQCLELGLGPWIEAVVAEGFPETVRAEQVPVGLWQRLP